MQRPTQPLPFDRLPRLFTKLGISTILLVLLLIAGALLVGFVRLAWIEHQLNQSIDRQQVAILTQRTLNEQLKGQADYSESDAAMEQAARDRLGMAREGETVIKPNVVIEPTATVAPPRSALGFSTSTEVRVANPREANALGWWHAFFPRHDVRP
ncbi:MAG: hypothetical protein NVS4B8_14090 [Herpetosiphon sp.]